MEYFIIIAVIIIFTIGLIISYIPFHLQNIAVKAGFVKFSVKYLFLKLRNIPISKLLLKYETLINSGYHIEFDSLLNYYEKSPNNFESLIQLLTGTLNPNETIDITELIDYNLNEQQIAGFLEIAAYKKQTNKSFSKEETMRLISSNLNLNRLFNIIKIAEKINYKLDSKMITNLNIETVEQFLILYQTNDFFKRLPEIGYFQNPDISWNSKLSILKAYSRLLEIDSQTDINELINISNFTLELNHYVNAVELIYKHQITEIELKDIQNHIIKGGNPEKIINAFNLIKAEQIQILPELLFEPELNNPDFEKLINNIINPVDIKIIPSISIILADGLQVSPEIMISVKQKPDKIKQKVDYNQVFKMINEKTFEIFNDFKTYQAILSELNNVAHKILSEITNKQCIDINFPLKIVDLKIIDIEIVADKLIAVKELESVEKAKELKLKILEEKRKFHENLNKALQNGEISNKDYQKEKYIFNTNDETDLPYHTS
jgi:uncharacterized protein YqfA (UPF0365 family)